jgi:alpha-D-xyloside xylohydrolase
MKFTDGAWLVQPGLKLHHPVEVHRVERVGDTLVVCAPTRPIRHRGDTLQGPVLTLRVDSPLEGVIRVSIEHYAGSGRRGPDTILPGLPRPEVEITESSEEIVFASGAIRARLAKSGDWSLNFERPDGVRYTRSGFRGAGYVEADDGRRFVFEQLDLGVGENVYGLGERFSAFVKNGQVVETWNKDGGTGGDQAYKSVPFYLTNRGYGILVNDTGPVSHEVASERVSRVQFSVPGERIEYLVIAGPTPKEVLARLTALTGRPALPPAWSFGLWLSTSFTTDYDEKTVHGFIDKFREYELPLHVFHYDCFWMRDYTWCDFTWDERTFPDPAGQLRRLHERGLKVCVWINPYISQFSRLFPEAVSGGFLLRRPDGEPWQTDQWQPGMGVVDFTNPAARAWYQEQLRRLMQMGVDCFKSDFGERIPTDVVYHDGSDPIRMHNRYAVLYNEAVFRAVEEVKGKGEALVFARSAHTGGQQFPVHWGGDCSSTYESMAESLRGGLSLGLCGFGYWSHDIGGFEGTPPADVYKRWVAFGLLSSHSRLHGSSSYRVPWNFDDEACNVLRIFTRLKCRLMPYLFGAACEAHDRGVPVMRAMVLEFPDDLGCASLDRQYMLGPDLLVAPVLSADGQIDYYLPPGRWRHLLTGETRSAGWHRERYDFMSLPVFVRGGTILALGADESRPDYDFAESVTLRLNDLADGESAATTIPQLNGGETTRVTAVRRGGEVVLTLSGRIPKHWCVEIAGAAGKPTRGDGKGALTVPV